MANSSFFKDGGSGTNSAAAIQNQLDQAAASAASAATSLASIDTQLTDATAAKVAAEAAQAAAETAKTASESARDTAITNRNAADASASSASTSATNSASSETNSAASQSAAATSASNAATSETNSAASQAAAATSASNAATSETNAAASATSSATAQAASESARDASVVAKNSSETAKTASEAARDLALSYRNTAETHKNDSAASATAAASSQSAAATSATGASSSASSAASAQTAAEAARDSALAAFDSFDDRYLGAKSSDPSTDNDGDALVAGSLIYNTTDNVVKIYTGSAWVAAYVSGGSFASLSGATFTGDVTVPNLITAGNVDGRDVSVDGAKLDGIEASATADQTAAEIRTLVESATDSNVFTDADHTKLNGIAAGATAVSSLTDLGISDGTNGQVLQTNGSGSFSFADAGGGGSTQDADGDTKIQVEEGTDDDTIRFDTAGSERMQITSTGNVGIGITNPTEKFTVVNSSSGIVGRFTNNTNQTLDLGVISGSGSAGGVSLNNANSGYLSFQSGGTDRMRINPSGSVGIGTTDLGIEGLTVAKVGSASYAAIQLQGGSDGASKGGQITMAQKDDSSTSWNALSGWDNGTHRTIYLGGGNFGQEEATKVQIYAGAYDAGSGGASEVAQFAATYNMLKKVTTVQDSGVPLRVDSTNSNSLKIRFEDNGSVVGYLGANSSNCLDLRDSGVNERMSLTQNGGQLKLISSGSSAQIRFNQNSTDRNYIYQSSANEIGFLTTSGGWAFKCDNSGNVTATGNVTAYSDIRLKDDILPIEGALERVSKLRGFEYTRKSTGKREIGFIAQDVIEHEPTLVDVVDTSTEHTDEAFTDLHVMKYQNTVALLVEAIKELKAEVAELRAGCCHGSTV